MSRNIFIKNTVFQKRKKTVILRKMLGISLMKKTRIFEKHNTNISKQLEKLNSCNIVAKMLQSFIKKVSEKDEKINGRSDRSLNDMIFFRIFEIKSGFSPHKPFFKKSRITLVHRVNILISSTTYLIFWYICYLSIFCSRFSFLICNLTLC